MQLTENAFMVGYQVLCEEAYDMPPLIYDEIFDKIRLVDQEISLWKSRKAEKPSWGFFRRLFEDTLARANEPSPWEC